MDKQSLLIVINNSLHPLDLEIPLEDGLVSFFPGLFFGDSIQPNPDGSFRLKLAGKTGEIFLFQ